MTRFRVSAPTRKGFVEVTRHEGTNLGQNVTGDAITRGVRNMPMVGGHNVTTYEAPLRSDTDAVTRVEKAVTAIEARGRGTLASRGPPGTLPVHVTRQPEIRTPDMRLADYDGFHHVPKDSPEAAELQRALSDGYESAARGNEGFQPIKRDDP